MGATDETAPAHNRPSLRGHSTTINGALETPSHPESPNGVLWDTSVPPPRRDGQANLGETHRRPVAHPTIGEREHPPNTPNLREGKE